MNLKNILVYAIIGIITCHDAVAQWSSALVKQTETGELLYTPDKRGNIIPDFSRVGYKQGRQNIPFIHVMRQVLPGGGDAQRIQQAIDEVSALPLQKDGFRGTVLLAKGTYYIEGTLFIKASGVVLRGEGEETILVAAGKGQRDLIRVSGTGNPIEVPGSRKKIVDKMVPVGKFTLTVSDASNFKAGDRIMLFRPGTSAWIHDLKMDSIVPSENTKQWQPAEYNLYFERTITSVKKNTISIDNPVMMEMEEKYGGGEIFKYQTPGRIEHIGVEDLVCVSEFSGNEDEDHGWVAVSFNRVENSWVSNITAKHFGYSCVHLGDQTKQITVRDCRNLDPKSKITGSRRYSFNNDGQLNLFINCFASGGRHDYVTGARACGPNVFYNCRAENTYADIGPHHRWSAGTLYDNITTDGEINIQDRGNWGTGHGWAGVTQVVWNSVAKKAAIQNPWVSGKNYAIGLSAEKVSGRLAGRQDGVWEGQNKKGLQPASLFTAQLAAGRAKDASALKKTVINNLHKIMLQDAAWAMQQQPVTITAFHAARSAGGPHDFFSEGDYWWPNPVHPDSPYIRKDGLSNPDNFTAHREALIRFSRITGALASAYRLTGDVKYAQQAMLHCRAWFVDSATRMNPSMLYAQAIKGRATGRGIGIIDTIHFLDVIMAMLALQETGVADNFTWQSIIQWFDSYLQWLTTHPYGIEERDAQNNHGTCWAMQVAVFATFTHHTALLDDCRYRFKNILLPKQMADDGSFPLELSRTKPFGYSIFNLDAMAILAHILSNTNDDLWSYEINGRSMKKGIQFLYPYVADKNKWPYPKDVMYWENWPVAQPFLLFGALHDRQNNWLQTWMQLDHAPKEPEVLRNFPLRYPLLWL